MTVTCTVTFSLKHVENNNSKKEQYIAIIKMV